MNDVSRSNSADLRYAAQLLLMSEKIESPDRDVVMIRQQEELKQLKSRNGQLKQSIEEMKLKWQIHIELLLEQQSPSQASASQSSSSFSSQTRTPKSKTEDDPNFSKNNPFVEHDDDSNPFSTMAQMDALKDENKALAHELEELRLRWENRMEMEVQEAQERQEKEKEKNSFLRLPFFDKKEKEKEKVNEEPTTSLLDSLLPKTLFAEVNTPTKNPEFVRDLALHSSFVNHYEPPMLFGVGAWEKEYWVLYNTHIDAYSDKSDADRFINFLILKKDEERGVTESLLSSLASPSNSTGLLLTDPNTSTLELPPTGPLYSISLLAKGVLCTLENFSDDLSVPFGHGFQLKTIEKTFIMQTDSHEATNAWIHKVASIVFGHPKVETDEIGEEKLESPGSNSKSGPPDSHSLSPRSDDEEFGGDEEEGEAEENEDNDLP